MIHKITVDSIDFHNIKRHFKFYDIRKNDRDYRIGDTIVYREQETFGYSGNEVKRDITYLETKCEGLQEGYVVLSIIATEKRNKSHKYNPKKRKTTEELMKE